MRIRALMDTPFPNAPDFHTIFQAELSEEANILNATNNTGVPWAVNVYQLIYSPGQTKYEIGVTDFGKPYLVTRVVDGPYITRINVPFGDLNQQRYGAVWQGYANSGPWTIESTTEKMSFFREGVTDSQYYASIEPAPQDTATYEITYVPGVASQDDPLSSVTQLPEHAALVQLRTAVALLPYAKWYEDEKENRIKRRELSEALIYQLNRPGGKEELFKRYVSSIALPKPTEIGDWLDDYCY
jgi:hypothetical protein